MTRACFALLGFALFCILLSCGRHPPTQPEPLPQTPSELIWDTKQGKDYTGKRLTLNLIPKTYTCAPGIGILWFHGPTQNTPPTLVLICAPPPGNTRAIRVTGLVRSIDHDETDRGGVKFTITMTVDAIEVR